MQKSEVMQLVESAHSELSADRSEELYRSAIKLCDDILKTHPTNDLLVIKSQSFKELAIQSQSSKMRTECWKLCLDTLKKPLQTVSDPYLAEQLAICTVEMFQDQFCEVEFSEKRARLRDSMSYVEASLKLQHSSTICSTMLARKSSLLRSRAQLEMSPIQSRLTLQESARCALKGLETHDLTGTKFELALCNWALARSEPTDEGYVRLLNDAEELFSSPEMLSVEVARLMLPRFYRMTYRPLDACEAFAGLESNVKHTRRFLSSVDTYAESAIHLWFQDFPQQTVMEHAHNALSLCERAIDAGFENARTVLNLAYLRSIHDGPDAGQIALKSLSISDKTEFWDEVIRLTDRTKSNDAATQSFVMGIVDSHVITRLGTFVLMFTDDVGLAGRIYRMAVRLGPQNAVALTNWARYCLRYDPEYSRADIERLLQKAGTYSDRRFRWWKAVLEELHGRSSDNRAKPKPLEEISNTSSDPTNLKSIRKRFKRISGLINPQKRGYELEKLVYQLARLSFGVAFPSYRFLRGAESSSQIDCYFEHRNDKYRVECKWTSKLLEPQEFIYFLDSLDVSGVSGLVISMSGFAPSTIERAQEHRKQRPVLLVDGEEMAMVFNGTINFDELLSIKRLHYDQCSETFHKVIASAH